MRTQGGSQRVPSLLSTLHSTGQQSSSSSSRSLCLQWTNNLCPARAAACCCSPRPPETQRYMQDRRRRCTERLTVCHQGSISGPTSMTQLVKARSASCLIRSFSFLLPSATVRAGEKKATSPPQPNLSVPFRLWCPSRRWRGRGDDPTVTGV